MNDSTVKARPHFNADSVFNCDNELQTIPITKNKFNVLSNDIKESDGVLNSNTINNDASTKRVFNAKKGMSRKQKKGGARAVRNTEGDLTVGGDLTVMYTNADSLLNKRDELHALIDIHKPLIIGIVEVKPKNLRYDVQECEIGLKGYHIFHNLNSVGRGVSLYVAETLRVTEVEMDSRLSEGVL